MPTKTDVLRYDITELMKKGDFNAVVDRCHVELTMARREDQYQVEIIALLGLAEGQCSLGHFDYARDYANQAVELSQDIHAVGLYVDALNVLARVLREGYFQTSEAYEAYNTAVNIAHEAGDMQRYGQTLIGMGELATNPSDSEKHAWKVIDIARGLNDQHLEARGVLILSNAFIRKNDYDKASDALSIALDLAKVSGDHLLESIVLGQQGLILIRNEQTFQQGLEQQLTALQVARGMEAVFHEFMRLHTIAMSALSAQDTTEARNYFDQMLALSQDVAHKPYEMYALGMLGHLHEANNKPDIAISYYGQATDLAKTVMNPQYEARYLYAIGMVYLSTQDFELARDYYNQAKNIYQALDDGRNANRITASIIYSYLLAFASRIMSLIGMSSKHTD